MKNLLFIAALSLLAVACQQENQVSQNESSPLQVLTTADYQVEYENLRLYPIVADQDFIADNEGVGKYINLSGAMENSRFRITEKKPYGRSDDRGAVNSLTIQNKSQDTVFLMTGDVVRGGNQDRMMAMDMVVPPRTITDIPVFCVEHGRWTYQEPEEGMNAEEERNRKIFAFTGYYHIASNDLRKTVKETGDQQAVWNKVDELTSVHNAQSNTQAYAALEQSEAFTSKRDAYLDYFKGRFADKKGVVGLLAVSGNKILGADVFGHPNLFQKQYESLLHSYITDALSNGKEVNVEASDLDRYIQNMLTHFNQGNGDDHFTYHGKLVHFTNL
ncbi:MAG: hypothetical protein DHS20C18_12400 [Saprospiraceae bacterium]|nr:MAG: hypothetical protein DHS20C18_12400 [Saprospiraceae bacterium]